MTWPDLQSLVQTKFPPLARRAGEQTASLVLSTLAGLKPVRLTPLARKEDRVTVDSNKLCCNPSDEYSASVRFRSNMRDSRVWP